MSFPNFDPSSKFSNLGPGSILPAQLKNSFEKTCGEMRESIMGKSGRTDQKIDSEPHEKPVKQGQHALEHVHAGLSYIGKGICNIGHAVTRIFANVLKDNSKISQEAKSKDTQENQHKMSDEDWKKQQAEVHKQARNLANAYIANMRAKASHSPEAQQKAHKDAAKEAEKKYQETFNKFGDDLSDLLNKNKPARDSTEISEADVVAEFDRMHQEKMNKYREGLEEVYEQDPHPQTPSHTMPESFQNEAAYQENAVPSEQTAPEGKVTQQDYKFAFEKLQKKLSHLQDDHSSKGLKGNIIFRINHDPEYLELDRKQHSHQLIDADKSRLENYMESVEQKFAKLGKINQQEFKKYNENYDAVSNKLQELAQSPDPKTRELAISVEKNLSQEYKKNFEVGDRDYTSSDIQSVNIDRNYLDRAMQLLALKG